MRTLLEMGRLAPLDDAARAFNDAVAQRQFFDASAFSSWSRRILVDHPAKVALILPPGTVLDGDLYLDGEADDPATQSIGTILALGDLT